MMVRNWRAALVSPETPVVEAIKVIEGNAAKVCLVADGDERLIGTVTDGDVRRAILRGVGLEAPVSLAMNTEPRSAPAGRPEESMRKEMNARQIRQFPLVDDDRRIVGLYSLIGPDDMPKDDHWVVVMAGGLGTRLRPLTEDTPKPMLTVGDKPLLQTIIERGRNYGFRNFYLSVNYRADAVTDYFGDGSSLGVNIRYLREETELGTAGALGLIEEIPANPLVVMNGDLLTNVDFDALLQFHGEQGAVATMAVREYDVEVPYGVVRTDGERILSIDEKPVHRFFVNAGIYVLEPEMLGRVDGRTRMDMTDLFESLLADEGRTAVFPIREYWLDIGREGDFVRANNDFQGNV